MSVNKISLKFYGRDFTKIKDTLDDSINLFGGTLDKEKQLSLIIKFLDSQKKSLSDLIVDTGKKESVKGKDKEEIYHIYNDEYYWSGLVGIVKGTLPSALYRDLFISDKENENNEYDDIDITIQIQSRFDTFEDGSVNNISNSKPYFLTTMLLQCKTGVNDQLVPNNSDDYFFDLLLLYLFKDKANNCYNKGLYKT